MQIILRGPAAGYEAEHTARLFFPDAEKVENLPQDSDFVLAQSHLCTDTILLRDRQLLLASVLNTNQNIILVSAVDAAEAYTARDQLLLSWLAVQALVTLAALAAGWHYGKVQELNARQSRFVADLTHELKTPLTSMIGYADLLRSGTLDDARRRTAAAASYWPCKGCKRTV